MSETSLVSGAVGHFEGGFLRAEPLGRGGDERPGMDCFVTCVPRNDVLFAGAVIRGTTEQGECRSHARMAMIEPLCWDLNEEKVHSSPSFLTLFIFETQYFSPEKGLFCA